MKLKKKAMMIESIEFKNAVATKAPSNHVIIVDVSYSMCYALPQLRKHLKENLPVLVKPEDTVSILYFSSRGQFGTVFAGRQIAGVADLSEINGLIDRYLCPTGCTGFVEPLRLAIDTAKTLSKPGVVNSMTFMTDGYDNCWRSNEIIEVAAELPKAYQNITFIEYGWNCNRQLLEKMSEVSGATHVFAEGQVEYQAELETALSTAAPRIEVDITGAYSAAIYIEGTTASILPIIDEDGRSFVRIPESVSKLWVVSPDMIDQLDGLTDLQAAYVLALYGVHTMDADLVWAALNKTGDVRFIKQYSNCFTKQDYSNIKSDLTAAIVDESLRGLDGIDYNLVPAEDATTVVDVLTYLADNDVSLVTQHPLFSYRRIGRGTVQKADDTEDKLAEQIADAETKEERKALALKLAQHEDWTPEFEPNDDKGIVPISNLVYNSERPNISVQTVQNGSVVVPKFAQDKFALPEQLDTWKYRNYTIVKDGIIHMKTLPIVVNNDNPVARAQVIQQLTDMGVHVFGGPEVYVVNLESVPLVNRAMTKNISAATFFTEVVRLESLKARQKVLKFYREQVVGKVNAKGLAAKFGAEAAAWLSDNGIRDYGFSPKTASVESSDFYMSRELNVKIKGISSLPSVNAVITKIEANKKLNAGDQMIANAIKDYDAFVKSDSMAAASDEVKTKMIEMWITDVSAAAIAQVRILNKSLSKVVYGIVAGHGWFTDLDMDSPTAEIKVDGVKYIVTAELAEKEIKI